MRSLQLIFLSLLLFFFSLASVIAEEKQVDGSTESKEQSKNSLFDKGVFSFFNEFDFLDVKKNSALTTKKVKSSETAKMSEKQNVECANVDTDNNDRGNNATKDDEKKSNKSKCVVGDEVDCSSANDVTSQSKSLDKKEDTFAKNSCELDCKVENCNKEKGGNKNQ